MEYPRERDCEASLPESSRPTTSWAEADPFTPRNGDELALSPSVSPSLLLNSSAESGVGSSLGTSLGDLLDYYEYSADNTAPRDEFTFSQTSVSERFTVTESKGVLSFITNSNCSDVAPDNPELFVKCIPAETSPGELMQFVERAGPLYKLRFMIDESNNSRGFAYVTYITLEATRAALEKLDDRPFGRRSVTLRIGMCQVNRRIFVGGIPITKTRDEAWRELLHNGIDGIVDVIMYRSYHNRALNRGFVFVEFRTHQLAALGRRELRRSQMWDRAVIVDWSIPNPDASEEVLSQVKILFLRNLDVNMSRSELHDFIRSYVSKDKIQKVYKFKDYAFIHLHERSAAEILMQFLLRHFKNSVVEVHWSNPSNALTDPQHRVKRVAKQTNCPRRLRSANVRDLPRELTWSTADNNSIVGVGTGAYPRRYSSINQRQSIQSTSEPSHIDLGSSSDGGMQVQVYYGPNVSGSDLQLAHNASSAIVPRGGNAYAARDLYQSFGNRLEINQFWNENIYNPVYDAFRNGNAPQYPVNLRRSRIGNFNGHSAPLLDQAAEFEAMADVDNLCEEFNNVCSRGITLQDLINMLSDPNEG